MKHLTKEQRYEIKAYLKCDRKKSFIAQELGVDISTIYREIKRNSTKHNIYNPELAHEMANERKERFVKKRKFTKQVRKNIEKYLREEQWSPEQIKGYCKINKIPMVSHESIYQYIRKDKIKGGSLYKFLRHRLKHRKQPVGGHTPVKDKVSIEKRPKIVEEKGRFGDWEIDTIIGKDRKGAIVTIVERTTGYLMMKKLKNGKEAKGLAKNLISMLIPYKKWVKTITSDNGTEFAEHKMISKKINADFYFAHPYSSWERGLNEYTNKLIRQYIPKKTSFDDFNDQDIKQIQLKINRRPRKKLGYESPKKLFFNFVNKKIAFGT